MISIDRKQISSEWINMIKASSPHYLNTLTRINLAGLRESNRSGDYIYLDLVRQSFPNLRAVAIQGQVTEATGLIHWSWILNHWAILLTGYSPKVWDELMKFPRHVTIAFELIAWHKMAKGCHRSKADECHALLRRFSEGKGKKGDQVGGCRRKYDETNYYQQYCHNNPVGDPNTRIAAHERDAK